jgi:hypothetical protein
VKFSKGKNSVKIKARVMGLGKGCTIKPEDTCEVSKEYL